MRSSSALRGLCGLLGALAAASIPAQAPPAASPSPSPTPSATVSPRPGVPGRAAAGPLRLTDPPVLSVSRLPPDNPFGGTFDSPAAFTGKPAFTELALAVPFYAALHVDRSGKVLESRRVRDPIPSLSADSKKSFDRWSFEPARKGGQPVETWASIRLDLGAVIRPPKLEQFTLTPISPNTPIPSPLEWGSDSSWYDRVKPGPIADGIVGVEQVDILATPRKTRWDADSYKGPFSCRFWVRVDAAGRIDRAVVLQVSEPLLIGYLRQQISGWQLKPAQAGGHPVDSWNELALSGQVGYSIEVKQIANLRKTILATP